MPEPATLFTLALLCGGIAVWGLALRRTARDEAILVPVRGDEPQWGAAAIVSVALFVAFQLFKRLQAEWQLLGGEELESTFSLDTVRASTAVNLVLFALLLLFLSEGGQRPLGDFGVHLRQPGWNAVIGGLGFLASFPPVLLVVFLTKPLQVEERTHPYIRLGLDDPTLEVLFWIGVAVVIAAPLAEELVFRVILQGWLRTKLPAAAAIGISSVLFCAIHGFPDSLALLPLAIVFGYVFERRRSYVAVVVMHAVFNAQSLVALVLRGSET